MKATEAAAPRKRPSGRRVGDSGTKDAILDAALNLFATLGYEAASIRAIASAAGVDPALIRHFFGDKETLFATTVADRTTIAVTVASALRGDDEGRGRRVCDTYLRLWEEPDTRPILLALVRSATTSEHAAAMLSEILGARARESVNEHTQGDEGVVARVALAGSHLLGVAIARYIVKLPAIAELSHETLVAEVAPTIQGYLGTRER